MIALRWPVGVVWWLATVFIALVLAVVVAWYYRQVSRRRLRPPGFFLIAVVIHVFLVVGSFYVYLDPGVAPQIQRQFQRIGHRLDPRRPAG